MALNPTMAWRMRAGGAETNGGGYDPSIGGGTDYTDQDAPQLSITDLTSTASTTVTSAAAGFTAAMVGNVLRLASGAGSTPGYYTIATFVSATEVTLDRVSGTYAGDGVASVGGAFAGFINFRGSGTATAPALTSPLAAGHTIYVRGGGTDDPGSADYTETSGYTTPAGGNTTDGKIAMIGYNGRPRFNTNGLWIYSITNWYFENLKLVPQNTTNSGNGGVISGGASVTYRNMIVDQNGLNCDGLGGTCFVDCEFRNTGSTAAGTLAAINGQSFNALIIGCYIDSWKAAGISIGNICTISHTIVRNCKLNGINIGAAASNYHANLVNVTVDGCTGDGLKTTAANGVYSLQMYNCIFSNNSGYGVNHSVGTVALNDRMERLICDFNNFYLNASGARNGISAGVNDMALDPQYVSTAGENFAIGPNLKAKGFPVAAIKGSSTTAYIDVGGVQRPEPVKVHPGMGGGMRG
jgi:hypothetical protein